MKLIKKVIKTVQLFIVLVVPLAGFKQFVKEFKKIWGIKSEKK